MSDEPRPSMPPPLTEDEKALLRRCYRVRSISDHAIVFPLAPAKDKAAFMTFAWLLCVGFFLGRRWGVVLKEAPSSLWNMWQRSCGRLNEPRVG
jgi:hypothetical protein